MQIIRPINVLNLSTGFFVIVLLTSILYHSHYQPSLKPTPLNSDDVYSVYAKLKKYTGSPGSIPNIIIKDTDEINAYAAPDSITITTGIIKHLKDQSELAVVLGHEMAHVMLGHVDGTDMQPTRLMESNADKFGMYLVVRAGFDPCAGGRVWTMMLDEFGDDIDGNIDHPGMAERAWGESFPQCKA